MFCNANLGKNSQLLFIVLNKLTLYKSNIILGIAAEQEAKLDKLLKLWESKSNYFESSVIEKMKNPSTSYQEYQANLISQYAPIITPLTLETKTMFEK